jgi:hypothetical protein
MFVCVRAMRACGLCVWRALAVGVRGGHWFVRVLASLLASAALLYSALARSRIALLCRVREPRTQVRLRAIGSKKGHDMACGWAFFEKAPTKGTRAL